ncbi:MAG: pseudaminic acid biosynthesis-associated methylase [Acidaminococcales bacterium]|jgi:spore coat polysaccharide biosynthesis protein SpsF|nr:pseudaminic acid biosynthesis-associated methylase [Acidaminococcales bacterium]
MTEFKTEQEKFWSGKFGDDYVDRSDGEVLVAANTALFARAFASVKKISSLIEFGANIGLNLKAIRQLLPESELAAIEINRKAAERLRTCGGVEVYEGSILDFRSEKTWDMTLIKGVLIHTAPDALPAVYDKLYKYSRRYICIVEYYNPTPVELDYRGHAGKLFKRDFAGEMLDRFPDLRLLDYGFTYRRDNNFAFGDGTWFILEKTGNAK